MKCMVLAGGSGDRMWPLSRKNYPKQFMKIRGERSMFQETIARNMAYCDEFFIVSGKEYHFMIEAQMKIFQGIQYRLFLEEESWKTTAAIILPCMLCAPSELIFVVASDHIIEGSPYKESVLRARELAKEGFLVTFGIPMTKADTRFGYLHAKGENILEFLEKPPKEQAEQFLKQGDHWWNSGMFLFCAGDMLQELKLHANEVWNACREAAGMLMHEQACTVISKDILSGIPKLSIEKTLFEKSLKIKMVSGEFSWQDVGSLEDLEAQSELHGTLDAQRQKNEITHSCQNLTIINQAEKQLIVANHCQDLMIVNTEDAIYIGKKGTTDELKTIIREHQEYHEYFEENRIAYRSWGTRQVLSESAGYRVKKVIIFPGKTIYTHRHEFRSEHWSIVSGTGRITLEGKMIDYAANESIYVPIGQAHQVSNIGEDNLIIIEVAVGKILQEEDMIKEVSEDISGTELGFQIEDFVKLSPAFKDYLWGGNKLKEKFGKNCDYNVIAESWELSAHEAGQSKVASGRHKGMLFGEYLKFIGRKYWGWKAQAFERFPIMIKLIDAREQLSVQVHPDDDFALEHEGEYGKNEVWYVIDCEEGAGIYCGFRDDVTQEEVRERVVNHTILEVLNWIPVKKGDVFYINTGTVHAIGAGIMLCEIQQSSNCTYRLYDYGRKDKYGNERALHLEQALEVCCLQKTSPDCIRPANNDVLCACKYFESRKIIVQGKEELSMGEASFASVLCIEGEINVGSSQEQMRLQAGEGIFIPAKKNMVQLVGIGTVIVTSV